MGACARGAEVTCPQVHQKVNSFFGGGVLRVDASRDYFIWFLTLSKQRTRCLRSNTAEVSCIFHLHMIFSVSSRPSAGFAAKRCCGGRPGLQQLIPVWEAPDRVSSMGTLHVLVMDFTPLCHVLQQPCVLLPAAFHTAPAQTEALFCFSIVNTLQREKTNTVAELSF